MTGMPLALSSWACLDQRTLGIVEAIIASGLAATPLLNALVMESGVAPVEMIWTSTPRCSAAPLTSLAMSAQMGARHCSKTIFLPRTLPLSGWLTPMSVGAWLYFSTSARAASTAGDAAAVVDAAVDALVVAAPVLAPVDVELSSLLPHAPSTSAPDASATATADARTGLR